MNNITLFINAYWWAIAVLCGGCAITHIIEKSPAAGKLVDRAIKKYFHADFNMESEE